jgi:hypothetical protein
MAQSADMTGTSVSVLSHQSSYSKRLCVISVSHQITRYPVSYLKAPYRPRPLSRDHPRQRPISFRFRFNILQITYPRVVR